MRGKSQIIRAGNGPEYISVKLTAWAERMGIHIQYIQPGKPQQNVIYSATITLSGTNGWPKHL